MSSPVGAHGEYRIAGLAPGEWTVSANTSHRRAEAKVTVAEANADAAVAKFQHGFCGLSYFVSDSNDMQRLQINILHFLGDSVFSIFS